MRSILPGTSQDNNLATSGTEYLAIVGGEINPSTTESAHQIVMSEDGTMKRFFVELFTAPGVGTSRTFTLRKNGQDQTLTVTISNTDTTGRDLNNSFSFVAGDLISISSTVSGTPAASRVMWCLMIDTSTPKRSILTFLLTSGQGYSNTATQNLSLGGEADFSTNTGNPMLAATSGKIKRLYVNLTTAPGAGKSRTITLEKNGSSTALSVVLSDSETQDSDLSNEITVVAGDSFRIVSTPSGTPASTTITICVTFEADTDGEFNFAATCLDGVGGNNVEGATFVSSGFRYGFSNNQDLELCDECTVRKIYIEDLNLGGGPGAGKFWDFYLEVEGSETGLIVTLTGTEVTGNAAFDISVSPGNSVRTVFRGRNSSNPTSATRISCLGYIEPENVNVSVIG